jgi:hypothetical protein
VDTSVSPVVEVPEKWSDIKCIRECVWVDEGVLDIPYNMEDKEDLKVIETDWQKCFHLYPLQTRIGKRAVKVKDVNPEDTYEMVPANENERVCFLAEDGEKPYIMLYHGLFTCIRV